MQWSGKNTILIIINGIWISHYRFIGRYTAIVTANNLKRQLDIKTLKHINALCSRASRFEMYHNQTMCHLTQKNVKFSHKRGNYQAHCDYMVRWSHLQNVCHVITKAIESMGCCFKVHMRVWHYFATIYSHCISISRFYYAKSGNSTLNTSVKIYLRNSSGNIHLGNGSK